MKRRMPQSLRRDRARVVADVTAARAAHSDSAGQRPHQPAESATTSRP